MKKTFTPLKTLLFIGFITLFSCQEEEFSTTESTMQKELQKKESTEKGNGHLQQTKTFSSDVAVSWLNMQLTMLRLPLPAGTVTQATDRAQAYSGIALYEAVVPGMPAYQSLTGQLNGFPAMPSTEPGKAYHWAASANAALAEINRKLFPGASAANKTAINNLEKALETQYASEVEPYTLARSIEFGKEVATRVFAWASTEITPNTCSYVDPTAAELLANPSLWVRTNPAAPAVNPCSRYTRFFVPDVSEGTALAGPPPFSTAQ